MNPELVKVVQAAMQAQFQAGYATAQLDAALTAAVPTPTVQESEKTE
jgi:hypothetical protein